MAHNRKKGQQDNSKVENGNRRKFLVTAGNSAIGIAALGSIGVTLDFISPNVVLEIPSRFTIGNLATIKLDSVTFDAEHNLFIFRDKQGYLYALSAVCTHLGCTARWNEGGIKGHPEGVIICPCHGSIFSKYGEVLSGPAVRPLDRFRMYLQDNKLYVNKAEKVTEEEMILKV